MAEAIRGNKGHGRRFDLTVRIGGVELSELERCGRSRCFGRALNLSSGATRCRRHSRAAGGTGLHPLFCQRYPTAACVLGNEKVRSPRDNVALSPKDSRGRASRHDDCQPHGGRELGSRGRVNLPQVLLNAVSR